MKSHKIWMFEDRYDLTNYLIRKWLTAAKVAIAQRGRFMVALNAEKSSTEFYCKLSNIVEQELWRDTHIFFTDERFISYEHKESHYRKLKTTLLDYINIPEENVHPMATYCADASYSSLQYEKEMRRIFKIGAQQAPVFDIIYLTLGDEGQVASLFPSDQSVAFHEDFCMPIYYKSPTYNRMSLTVPLINQARQVILMMTGARQAEHARSVILEHQFPVSLIDPHNGEMMICLDTPAARLIPRKEDFVLHQEAVVCEF